VKVAAFLFSPLLFVAWLGNYGVIPTEHIALLLVLSLLVPFVAYILIENHRNAREVAARGARKDQPKG
jgi:hypothetical protein